MQLLVTEVSSLPSGRFGANSAWILCAAIAHHLLRAAGVLAGDQHTRARGSTLRRRIVTVAARLARPQRRPILHLPTHWPWSKQWLALWRNTIGYSPTTIRASLIHPPKGPTGTQQAKLGRPAATTCPQPRQSRSTHASTFSQARRWIKATEGGGGAKSGFACRTPSFGETPDVRAESGGRCRGE